MEDYINFDRQDIGQASLDEALSCLNRIANNQHLWKYAIIAIHNALQCYMSIALRGSSGINTWKKPHANKWLKAYESNQELPNVQLNYFMELYDKLFIDKADEERGLVKWLNETRNEFIHFDSDSFSVHEPSLFSAFEQALDEIVLTPSLSKGIFFYYDGQQTRFNESCKNLSSQLKKLKKSNHSDNVNAAGV